MTDTIEIHVPASDLERHAKATARLERELAKPDTRPICPKHGPKGVQGGSFVCCGLVHEAVPEVAVKASGW